MKLITCIMIVVILLVIFIKNINSSYISITRGIIRMMKSDSNMYNTFNTMVTPTITTRITNNNNNNNDSNNTNNMIYNNDDDSNTNNVYERWSSPSSLDGVWRTVYSDIDNKITGRDYVDLFDNTIIGVVNTLPLSRLTLSPSTSLWAVINSTTQVVLSLLSLL